MAIQTLSDLYSLNLHIFQEEKQGKKLYWKLGFTALSQDSHDTF